MRTESVSGKSVSSAWRNKGRGTSGALWVAVLAGLASAAAGARGRAEDIITTVAGGGPPDGLPATSVGMRPYGVAVDADGNVYIVSTSGNVVFKRDALTGTLSRAAGNGGYGFLGDGGSAAAARLASPYGVAVDAAGNLYIADGGNRRIRRVDAGTGTITTVAGNGSYGFSGDGGPATAAALAYPSGVATDAAGNVYIGDGVNLRIRRVDAGTGTITTVAGNGISGFFGDGGPATAASFSNPSGVAVDAAGNLYIADASSHRIRRVDAGTGTITTVAGNGSYGFSGDGGPATAAALGYPSGVSTDVAGNLYIADTSNRRIRRVDALAGTIATVAGNDSYGFSGDGGPAAAAGLTYPYGVAVDAAGNLYIVDTNNQRIRRVDAGTGTIATVAGNGSPSFIGDSGPATAAGLSYPQGVAADAAGNVYIADSNNYRVRRVEAATGTITTVAGNGSYGFSGDGGPATAARLASPCGVARDAAGNLYIADTGNRRIRRVDAGTGTMTTVAGNGAYGFSGDGGPATAAQLGQPQAVAADDMGNFYIADPGNHRVRRVDAGTGTITTVAGNGSHGFSGDGGPATAAQLNLPYGVALDAGGHLYIADTNNFRTRRVDAGTGTITTVAGNGFYGFSGDGGPATAAALRQPQGVAVDAAGHLYIADTGNQRIRRVDAGTGTIATVAGNGAFGFSGDGGLAAAAALANPLGVAVDAAGKLYIADLYNHRVRRVTLDTPAAGLPPRVIAVAPLRAIDGDDPSVTANGQDVSHHFPGVALRATSGIGGGAVFAGSGDQASPTTGVRLFRHSSALGEQERWHASGESGWLRAELAAPAHAAVIDAIEIGGDGAAAELRAYGSTGALLGSAAGPAGTTLAISGVGPISALEAAGTTGPVALDNLRLGATGGGDGSSWFDAFTDLQAALAAAAASGGAIDDIWVAAGTYRPAGPGGDRTLSFQLRNGIALHGGFAGVEARLQDRDPARNVTVLSGDLNGDDLPGFAQNAENSHHVVTGNGTGPTAVLDGFTIRGGNANGGSPSFTAPREGGGLRVQNGSPTVRSCKFEGNTALVRGGGVYSLNGSPSFTGCAFQGNAAPSGGGMANNGIAGGAPVFRDCLFSGNSSAGAGAGLDNFRSPARLTGCTFLGNASSGDGGGVECLESDMELVNCAFLGNTAGLVGGGFSNKSFSLPSRPAFVNCSFSGNRAGTAGTPAGGGGLFNLGDPALVLCTFASNRAMSINSGGGILTRGGSMDIVNSIFWGNRDVGGLDESAQIQVDGGTVAIDFSDVQGLTGSLGGAGNIGADPLFADADGADNVAGTADDYLGLADGSPCIDRGDNAAVPADAADADGDGNTSERLPVGLDGTPRVANDPSTPDTGSGTAPIVDLGAHEHSTDCNGNLVPDAAETDTDLDGVIDACDADDDADGILDPVDIDPLAVSAAFLNAFTFGQFTGGSPAASGVQVRDAADPGAGVEIEVSGAGPVGLLACAFGGQVFLTQGLYTVTCGSVVIDVVEGEATVVAEVDGDVNVVVVPQASTAEVEEALDPDTGEPSGIVVSALAGEVIVNDEVVPEGETVVVTGDEDGDGIADEDDLCPAIAATESVTVSYTGDMLVAADAGGTAVVLLRAVVTGSGGEPLAGVPVSFAVQGSDGGAAPPCGATTDTLGEAACTLALAPDVYTAAVTLGQPGCPAAIGDALVVVFDPNVPRATGGGFILPDAESTLPAAGAGDKAHFGFIVRIENNQAAGGNLEFQYRAADLNLKSAAMAWYTVSNNKAMFQGTATVNGAGLFTFRVKATDGDLTGDQADAFDITIWSGTDTEAAPFHRARNDVAGGSIVIHGR